MKICFAKLFCTLKGVSYSQSCCKPSKIACYYYILFVNLRRSNLFFYLFKSHFNHTIRGMKIETAILSHRSRAYVNTGL